VTNRPPPNPAVIAFLAQQLAYFKDPRNGPDYANPPKPPTPEIAFEVGVSAASLAAAILDVYKIVQKTGKVPCCLPDDCDPYNPSMESRLEVSALFDKYIQMRGM
jgi:hypothetical protein